MKYIIDIKGEIEGDYEIIGKYEERPMSDPIDRQATIDAIDNCSVWVVYTQGDSQKDEAEFVENIIKQTKKAIQSMLIEDLPSAQPDKTYEQGWKDGQEALKKEMWEDGRDRLD